MPHEVGRAEPNRQDVRRRVPSKPELLHESGGESQGRSVELRGGAEAASITRGPSQRPGADWLPAAWNRIDLRLARAKRRRFKRREPCCDCLRKRLVEGLHGPRNRAPDGIGRELFSIEIPALVG